MLFVSTIFRFAGCTGSWKSYSSTLAYNFVTTFLRNPLKKLEKYVKDTKNATKNFF